MPYEDWTIKGDPPVRGRMVTYESDGLSTKQRVKMANYAQEMNSLTKSQYVLALMRWEGGENSSQYVNEYRRVSILQEYVDEARVAAVAVVPSAEARLKFA